VETEQMDKRVSWLDEQRRKDSEHIARIHERLDGFEDALAGQSAQLEDLATDLARISAVAARIRQFDDSLDKHREEVGKQLETIDQRRIARESQLESIRKSDQNQVSDLLDEMRVRLGAIDELRDSLETRRQEELRLNRAQDALTTQVKDLSREVEQRGHSLASLQESKKQESKRVSDLESRGSDLARRIDALHGPMDVMDDQLGKLKAKFGELERDESELRHSQTVWSEQQSVRLAEFERQWKSWDKQFQAFVEQAGAMDQKLESYQETFRELVRLREELQGVTQALERRISEVGEIQRLNAERFREDWAGFQADDQKRWTGFTLGSEELWKDHGRTHEKLNADLHGIKADLEDSLAALAELSRSNKQHLLELIGLVGDWEAELKQNDQAD